MGILLKCLLIFFVITLEARPISYSGGSTLMLMSDNMQDSIYFHYSPSYKISIGIEGVKDQIFDKDFSYLRLTYLLNRKNTKHSQRNLYFQSGVSSEGMDSHFFGIHGDWETRRLFVGFGFKEVFNEINDYTEKFIQTGFAPYLGDYGDLHTWIMIKSKHNTLTGEWNTYPVLKFFKGNFLAEVGYDNQTDWDIHLMYRF